MVTEVPFIELTQNGQNLLLCKMPASILALVSYASARGKDDEVGSVQRYLNTSRISAIKDFTLKGGQFPNAIVLNWVSEEYPLGFEGSTLIIPNVVRSAQLIDGQHRVAGLKAAIEEKPEVADLEIPVAIYVGLDTRECANIFLAINTEQKPVPRSLVFDLYGVANEDFVDQAAVRARDIVMAMNDDDTSAYFELIKLPGSPRRKGGIALSTAIAAIKPTVEEKGDFEQVGIRELESQKRAMMNFFAVLKEKYGSKWDDSTNAFMYAAGFTGAVEFFRKRLIPQCYIAKSFSKETFSELLSLSPDNLIYQEEIKGIGGKDAPKMIFERLVSSFHPKDANEMMSF